MSHHWRYRNAVAVSSYPVGTTRSVLGLNNEQRVCEYLQNRPHALFDSEYGCAPLIKATAAVAADKLMRIRSNRCLWSAPPSYSGKGRPKIHGQQFKLNESQSWWEAEKTREFVDVKLGKIRPVKMG